MYSPTSLGSAAAKASSVGNRVNSAGVTRFTRAHADVPDEIRRKNGITECTLRMSVGIEDVKDLLAELEKVFAEAEQKIEG